MSIPFTNESLMNYKMDLKMQMLLHRQKQLERCATQEEKDKLLDRWATQDAAEEIADAIRSQRRGGLFF